MVQIRGINKTDYDAIVSVLDRWWGGPAGERAHPVFFYELGDMALVAEEDDAILGFLLGFVAKGPPKVGYVHLVGIHPEHRRRGVGKMLYERFIEECRADGATQLKAIAPRGNEGSVLFHRALGFTVRDEENYAGPGRPRAVFMKVL